MIERVRYVKSSVDNSKQGVLVLVYDKGYFGAGLSFCKVSEEETDKFDKEVGKSLARARAMECLKNNKLYLRDLDKATDPMTILKLTGCNFPQGNAAMAKDEELIVKLFDIVTTFSATVADMIYTLALAKVKAETED